MDLDELRGGINRLDHIIQDAFTERMELCKEVARWKQSQGLQIFQIDILEYVPGLFAQRSAVYQKEDPAESAGL